MPFCRILSVNSTFLCAGISIVPEKETSIMTNQALKHFTKGFPNPFWNSFSEDFFLNPVFSDSAAVTVPVNIHRTENAIFMEVSIPGFTREEINIGIEKGNLMTISGEHKTTSESVEKKYQRKEFNKTSFTRAFRLPEEIHLEHISAKLDQGILTVQVPLKNRSEAENELVRKIEIK